MKEGYIFSNARICQSPTLPIPTVESDSLSLEEKKVIDNVSRHFDESRVDYLGYKTLEYLVNSWEFIRLGNEVHRRLERIRSNIDEKSRREVQHFICRRFVDVTSFLTLNDIKGNDYLTTSSTELYLILLNNLDGISQRELVIMMPDAFVMKKENQKLTVFQFGHYFLGGGQDYESYQGLSGEEKKEWWSQKFPIQTEMTKGLQRLGLNGLYNINGAENISQVYVIPRGLKKIADAECYYGAFSIPFIHYASWRILEGIEQFMQTSNHAIVQRPVHQVRG